VRNQRFRTGIFEVVDGLSSRAIWNGVALAESDDTVVVEGNHYFPPESLRQQYFTGL
jgi:uncharacterized protein (DUF427 family)